MVKEFLYRGLSKEDLDNTSLEKLFLLFNLITKFIIYLNEIQEYYIY